MRAWISQLRKGLIELAVLGVLRDGEAYGYQILQRLAQSDGLDTTESTVYPILARLAEEELVKVRVGESPTGPPRRYYRLTAAGQQRLREMAGHWQHLRDAVDHLVDGAKP